MTGRVYSGEFFLTRRLRLFYLKFEKIALEVLVSLYLGNTGQFFAIDNTQNLRPAKRIGRMGNMGNGLLRAINVILADTGIGLNNFNHVAV